MTLFSPLLPCLLPLFLLFFPVDMFAKVDIGKVAST